MQNGEQHFDGYLSFSVEVKLFEAVKSFTIVGTIQEHSRFAFVQDNYILISMVFMGLVCVWHAVAPSVGISWADKGVLIGLGVLFISLNVGFFVFIHLFVGVVLYS